MKSVADMSIEELAGWVCETLENAGITTTLTGGACVTIWSDGHYVSRDLDFVEEGPVPRCQIRNVLTERIALLPSSTGMTRWRLSRRCSSLKSSASTSLT